MLAQIIRDRWRATSPDLATAFVRHEAHVLPGSFVLGASVPTESAAKAISSAQQIIQALVQAGPTVVELENARSQMLAEVSRRTSESESIADMWLDFETFKLDPLNLQINSLRGLTSMDLQRVAGRLFKDAAKATVVVGNVAQLKSIFGETVEVRGAKPEVKTAPDPAAPGKKP